MMRAIMLCAAGMFMVAGTLRGQTSRVFHGEVSDSQCALNVHSLTRSHQEMLKSKSMGGTANTCSVYCIEHMGGYLVLSSGKDVYRLDRSDLVHGLESVQRRAGGHSSGGGLESEVGFLSAERAPSLEGQGPRL